MKKGMILYKSKYGAAKKYALWLKDMTDFPCAEISNAALNEAAQCDTIVFCGGIYASGIAGLSFLKKNIEKLKNKKIAVFCVGASPFNEKAFEEIKRHNLKNGLDHIPLFYGRGAWNEDNMTFKDRMLCSLLQKAVAKKSPDSYEPWEEALMSAVGQTCDWTEQKYLLPLLDYLR